MKLVIVDRDGVLNVDAKESIKSPEEWVPIEGSLDAIATLNDAGFRVVVATNQSGVGRGLIDMLTLNRIHRKMIDAMRVVGARIDAIFYCPHAEEKGCDCRKPKPGMILDIGRRFGVDLAKVPAVGDARRDLLAAKAAGAIPMLVRTGKGEQTLAEDELPDNTLVFTNLAEASGYIIAHYS
jgi:D-glycero-D-manno-heptose 1,7-bisphosphate phosphatase